MILAIDTATRTASIALYDASGILAEETWHSQNRHSVELMPAIQRLAERQGVKLGDLSAVAVALGPGSFTGLRIGLSAAKGLCLALDIPLIGIPTLMIAAYAAGDPGCPLYAIAEAGRGRICVGAFRYVDGVPELQGEIELHRSAEWTPDLSDYALVTGELDGQLVDRLNALEGAERLSLVSPAGSLRRAGYLAELAWDRLASGSVDDLDTLQPMYVQQPLTGSGS